MNTVLNLQAFKEDSAVSPNSIFTFKCQISLKVPVTK